MRAGPMAGRYYGPSNSAAGKLLKQVWEARQQGAREESFRLLGEALKLAEGADASSADYAVDIRAIAQQYQGLGFVLRAEQVLNAAIQRTVAAPEGQVSLKIDLLNLYAAEQRRMELLRLGDEILAGSAAVPQRNRGMLIGPIQQMVTAADSSGQAARAETYARRSVEFSEPNTPPYVLVEYLNRHGRGDEARALLKKSAEAAAGGNGQEIQKLQARQMEMYQLQREGKLSEAIEMQKQLIAEAGQANGGVPGLSFSMKQNLANMLSQSGNPVEARRVWQEVLAEAESQQPREQYIQQVLSYAAWLTWQAKQPGEAALVIEPYLSQEDLAPHLKLQAVSAMGGIEQQRGNEAKAAEWRARAMEMQGQLAQSQSRQGISIMGDMQKMQAAAGAGRVEETMQLAERVIETAPRAADGEGFAHAVASAARMIRGKAPEESAQLMARLAAAAEAMSAWWAAPLQQVLEQQTQQFMERREWEEARGSLKKWQGYVEQTRGPASTAVTQVMQTRVSLEQMMGNNAGAMRELEVWLKHVEANSGAESREVFSGLMQSARMCATSKDVGRGVVLVEKASGLIDKVAPANDASRVYMRGEAADVMAQLGNYDAALALAEQAQKLGAGVTPKNHGLDEQVERYRRMRDQR